MVGEMGIQLVGYGSAFGSILLSHLVEAPLALVGERVVLGDRRLFHHLVWLNK